MGRSLLLIQGTDKATEWVRVIAPKNRANYQITPGGKYPS